MFYLYKKYGLSFIIALILHATLFIILFTSIIFNSKMPYVVNKGPEKKIVNAVAINQQAVKDEILKLKAREALKRRAENGRINHLKMVAQTAKKRRQQEQKRLRNLQRKQLATQKLAQTKLAKLKKRQTLQQKQNEDAAKKYRAEQQRLTKLHKALTELKTKQRREQQKEDAKNLLQEQLKAEQQQLKSARAHYVQGVINKYNALILQAIRNNWLIPVNKNPDSQVQIQIRLGTNGTVLSANVIRPSEDSALDQSAITAIYKASPLPVPSDKDLFNRFKQFTITMTPKQVV